MKVFLVFSTPESAESAQQWIQDAMLANAPGYNATRWSDVMKHPEREEWCIAWDEDRGAGVGVTADPVALGALHSITPDEADADGWFPQPDVPALSALDQAEIDGYPVEPEGFTLALRKKDRDAFTQLVTMIQLADEMGMASTHYPLKDINGVTQIVTRQRLKEILLGYGAYYASLVFAE